MDSWWKKPRRIAVVIDNDEWMLPWCERLVEEIRQSGDEVALYRNISELKEGDVSFFLSCHTIVSTEILALARRNLVVHASALPQGRGMSPLTWQILDGINTIPVCLLEAAEQVDSGEVIYRETLSLEGHELIDEIRAFLGRLSLDLCLRFLSEAEAPAGVAQEGDPTYFAKRNPQDSRLDLSISLAEQFNLLRVVDNERYPAWFEHKGERYRLRIEKYRDEDGDG